MVKIAIGQSGKNIPVKRVIVTVQGEVADENWI
jgi:hypothetical protein